MNFGKLSIAGLVLAASGCASVAPPASPAYDWEAAPVATASPAPSPVSLPAQDASPSAGPSHVSVLLGQRWMDSDWDPVDDQLVLGIGYDTPLSSFPVEFEAMVARSKDESGSVEGITRELSAGIRKTFVVGEPKFHPYVGGGLSILHAEVEAPGPDDDDTSIALYLHGGAGYDLAPNWQLGLDLRVLFGSDIELNGSDVDSDYTQLALYLAYAF